ncbi:MAG: bestrophin-like domain [Salinarimonas sp.]
MLIHAFSFDSLMLLAIILIAGAVSYGIAVLILRIMHRRLEGEGARVPVPAYFTAVTTIWALIFGFVAAEVWQMNNRAVEASLAERSSIQRLAGSAAVEALDLFALRVGLSDYVTAVTEDEWGAGANREPHPRADAAVQAIRLALLEAARTNTPEPLLAKMIVDFDELQDARELRLAIGQRHVAELKWALVVVLALLSQIAIAFVHRDRLRAGRAAIAIFTVAACLSIWLVALHASPYSGSVSISPQNLTALF